MAHRTKFVGLRHYPSNRCFTLSMWLPIWLYKIGLAVIPLTRQTLFFGWMGWVFSLKKTLFYLLNTHLFNFWYDLPKIKFETFDITMIRSCIHNVYVFNITSALLPLGLLVYISDMKQGVKLTLPGRPWQNNIKPGRIFMGPNPLAAPHYKLFMSF